MEYREVEDYLKKFSIKEPGEEFKFEVIDSGRKVWERERVLFSTAIYNVFRVLSYACGFILIILTASFYFHSQPISKSENGEMEKFCGVVEFYAGLRENGQKIFELKQLGGSSQTDRIQHRKTTPMNSKEKKKNGLNHSQRINKILKVFC